ncbi:MAG: L-glutamate gamma-semialdehyde dehydrogenase [Candidatus Marinimicrobia bacterium]|jgi:1-pyrroline-5-carboxylate dehydrogenase|nr:L-glutamate gamma-semialdehyde dehydrogenase [Candidatus Neomarinimicrobiota bacterium]MBT3618603.1 L-glutamate gamma-semialdehyde dehydrogenase [Candidatus Neomarinimicrobiota bacterium]MBT3829635.1 L-glutamate gamma-semialdehyde dehydrogenase [Candidatus Neomarinimicrobiota bacterium]MBT3997352.1 L-glutamate gamma-semialdehyde dehydrogenase [Candidatus Neomarinimicrobiota bacterium]MBT4281041.1 L-glutamate gamma-semialdehyde dehydrogenase [Candidatus Neomarinimicrobiota bacterium]
MSIPIPVNEPILEFSAGSPEKHSLKEKLAELSGKEIEIPLIINGEEVKTGNIGTCVMPHDHGHVLAHFHQAGEPEVQQAIESSLNAWKSWSKTHLQERADVLLKAADLLAGPWRNTLNAATMLNMSKNAYQAEIDAACELIDFWRFNPYFAQEIHNQNPMYSPDGTRNSSEHRPLEGFVFAVTPFNFISIGGNLPTAPALMGNVALWKPASSAVYPAYFVMEILKEAGLPNGVINFIPGSGAVVGPLVMNHPNFTGVHFTGSTPVFQGMWKTIGENISNYKSYPRIVGETGGKDFAIVHKSANPDAVITAMVRGAFEFQGQKCSALSRAYIPNPLWNKINEKFISEVQSIQMGDVQNFSNFMNAVIDKAAFESIMEFISYAKHHEDAEILIGGNGDDSTGYFIDPTVILTTDPHFKTMEEEIFGPVLTVYLYDPADWDSTLKLVDSTSPYALTGCVIAEDEKAIKEAREFLTHSAGNFYINDKPTGAVVGQQPFGGGRASGTNDKAGSMLNLQRWVSQRTIKETHNPPKNYRYPFLEEE